MATIRPPSSQFLIVTPSYNQAQFIQQTIDSVISQRSAEIEVRYFVADGKSSDHTTSILKKSLKTDEWISEKDQGQTDAINKGIKRWSMVNDQWRIAKNPPSTIDHRSCYFAYINSDDFYLPQAFEQVAKAFEENPDKAWLVGDAMIIDQDNMEIQSPIRWYKKIIRMLLPSWILFILNPYPQPATFIRWSAVQEVGEFNTTLRYTMDYEYWLRLRRQFGDPIFVSEPLASFRIHTQSKGGSQFHKQFAEELTVARRFTKNPLLLSLHTIHNSVIKWVYGKIKN